MKQLEELKQEYTRLFVRFLKERGEWYIWKNVFQEYGTFQKTMDLCVSTEYDRLKVNLQGIFVWTKYNIKVTTPFYVLQRIKGFSVSDIYERNQGFYSRIAFNNLVTNGKGS